MNSLMSFLKPWGGKKEQSLTSQPLETESSFEKCSQKDLMVKLAELLIENDKLKKEIELRDLYENPEYDI